MATEEKYQKLLGQYFDLKVEYDALQKNADGQLSSGRTSSAATADRVNDGSRTCLHLRLDACLRTCLCMAPRM